MGSIEAPESRVRRAPVQGAHAHQHTSADAALGIVHHLDPATTAKAAKRFGHADPARGPPHPERKGRAATPPRDERAGVAYALGIDGHARRAAEAQGAWAPPPAVGSPPGARDDAFAPGEMFALMQHGHAQGALAQRLCVLTSSPSPRSPRAGRDFAYAGEQAKSLRAWR